MFAVSVSPLLAIFASLGGVIAMGASWFSQRSRNLIVVFAAALQVVVLLTMIPEVAGGRTIDFILSPFLPEADIAFRVDGLGLLFALIASALWLLSAIYAIGYLEALHSPKQARFQALFALTIACTLGVAFASNLVTLYIFYEAMTIATYFLVTHDDTEEAHASGRRYLAYHLGTSVAFLLPAIILTYTFAGSFDFKPGGVFGPLDLDAHRGILTVMFLLFLAGSSKVALMPFHGWLPGAMVAPVPVSALLHAVAVVNAGAYGVVRIMLDVFGYDAMRELGLDQIAVVVASCTVLAASFYALRLDSLKALLAFSTIGQLGYIVLGAALGNEAGALGSMLHILNHGVAKITLFLCAGAIYVSTHKKNLSEMRGLAGEMPMIVAAFAIGSFSMIGLPFTAGFISKLYLFSGAQQAGNTLAVLALVISSLLAAAYYLRALAIFFDRSAHAPDQSLLASTGRIETDSRMLVPILICAATVVVLGLFPEPMITALLEPVAEASIAR